MTSQFVLGLMNRGPGALQHPGEALKEKNAGCGMETEHGFLKQGEELCFPLPGFAFAPGNNHREFPVTVFKMGQ